MGPTSCIGPKTSRAARDRPETNPKRNQTSHHDIAGDSPEQRPTGGAATTKLATVARATPRQARRNAVRKSRAAIAHRAPSGEPHRPAAARHRRTRDATPRAVASTITLRRPGDLRELCAKRRSLPATIVASARPASRTAAQPPTPATRNLCAKRSAVSDNSCEEAPIHARPARMYRARSCITDSACKNQLVMVSVQYGPFNTYIPIRSTTIGKSRVAIDPIALHTSWRSNSDIASVTSIGYPRMSASGESSTTMHRLLHASGSHPIPTPCDPKLRRKLMAKNRFRESYWSYVSLPLRELMKSVISCWWRRSNTLSLREIRRSANARKSVVAHFRFLL
ncbi:hypothetical protein F511_37180 [Dorcoceras hygrometricum]|uniref:Uncharacterized protein n=1 Tax=Dorcoceras hygrometricum TaxID=472368 RepID=A0A2Z7B5S7_9LAMI|nr:hypothetical protein F511_37180 [Dorcoceras hygrometricum]